MSARKLLCHRKRGSVLVVTALLGTGLAMALGSFIMLTVQAAKLSNRSFYSNSVLNLAEAGLEEAIWSLNNGDWSGWSDHDGSSTDKTRTYANLDLDQGVTGQVCVVVYGATNSSTPRIVAEGLASPNIGPTISKQVEVRVGRRSRWANGIVAKDQIRFAGGVAHVDSYLSSAGYDPANPRDNGSAASVSVATDAITLSNAKVFGRVATGGSAPSVGPNGEIRGYDTPSGVLVDTNRISNDFYADLDSVSAPATGSAIVLTSISSTTTLTGSSDPSTPTIYLVSSIDLKSSESLTIVGYVDLVVTNDITIKGTFTVGATDPTTGDLIASGVDVYVEGDVAISGNGMVNLTGTPSSMVIIGTETTTGQQDITLAGNGAIQAAVYAPFAEITLNGGGSGGVWYGSVVGESVNVNGNYDFHYDEDLQNETSGNPFAVSKWRELYDASDRVSL